MTRITHRSIQESTLANLQRNLSAMSTIQEQLSTQKRINRASDDPVGAVSALQLRSELRATDQHRRSADDGNGWLNSTNGALLTTTEQLRVAKGLTTQALNTGAQSATSRAAIAVQIEGIRDDLVNLANTSYLGRSVFAGTSTGEAVTRTATGEGADYAWASTGPGQGQVLRQVSADATVRVDTDGRAVFGEGADSVFALLDRIAEQARAGSPELSASLEALDARYATVTGHLADVGARQVRVDRAVQQAQDRELALTTSLDEVEAIDLPATIVALQSQEVAYKAALGATAKVLQPSLMDFLR